MSPIIIFLGLSSLAAISYVGFVIHKKKANFERDRSFSEPDLSDPLKHLSRFIIKHPHEYISVDDLKYFRRKKPPDFHTRSNICLYNKNEPVLPFSSLKTEYQKHFHALDLSLRPHLLRRSTSLRLEGLMYHKSEHQEQYHWYSPEDWQSCRSFPIRNPENLRIGGGINMDPEYRSSYICYPMVDRTAKILPREMFHIEPESSKSNKNNHIKQQSLERSPEEVAALNKLTEDKFKRDLAAQEQHKCHLQQRDADVKEKTITSPSEYRRQFVQFPIEKAHSIPQISHIKLQGEFVGIPEYSDRFRMYDNYSKSAPIKKADNLRQSGAEAQLTAEEAVDGTTPVPEYREKFRMPPKDATKDKFHKINDHLHPRGEFTIDVPEYYESFRDPQIKQMPERGKCREPYLRLKGKIEFNPEYRSTYLDFPRSRPIVKKSTSSFRLPISSTTAETAAVATTSTASDPPKSPKRTPRRKYKSSSPNRYQDTAVDPSVDLTATPEYRRAHYNYQLRERTPPRKAVESNAVVGGNPKALPITKTRKSSDSSPEPAGKYSNANKRRTSRHRQASILDQQHLSTQSGLENVVGVSATKKPARFGRRSSVLQNADKCRGNSSIVEGNPKYALSIRHQDKCNRENQDSFVVLDEPCKRSNWMKKSWYES